MPQSFFEAASKNEVLQVVFFSVIFALALTKVRSGPKEVMLHFCEALAEVMFKFTGIVMLFAPIGVGAALAVTVGHGGLSLLSSLGKLVLTLYVALVVFGVGVLLPVAWIARVPIRRFLRAVKEPALIAFSTTSSEGRAAQGDGADGAAGSAAAHRRVRVADGGTPSTSMAARSTSRWPRCSRRRRRG